MKTPKVIGAASPSKTPKTPPTAKATGRIANLGAYAHPPKKKK